MAETKRHEANAMEVVGLSADVDEFRQHNSLTHHDYDTALHPIIKRVIILLAWNASLSRSHVRYSEIQADLKVIFVVRNSRRSRNHIRCPEIQDDTEVIFAIQNSTNIQKSYSLS